MATVNILFKKTHVFIYWLLEKCVLDCRSYLSVLFLDVSIQNKKYYIKVTMFNLFWVSIGYTCIQHLICSSSNSVAM